MKLHKHTELIEAMARTLYEYDADNSGWPVAWESLDEMDEPHIKQKVYLRQATAALNALLPYIQQELNEARNAALEEAAECAEDCNSEDTRWMIAEAIRFLKTPTGWENKTSSRPDTTSGNS